MNEHNLRETEIEPWYKKFTENGIYYGPSFRGVSNLRAYSRKNLATADMILKPTMATSAGFESSYPLHPATMDICLQLAVVACHGGQVENFKKAYVPIAVDSMSLWVPDMLDEQGALVRGIATGELRGLRGAYAQVQLFGKSGLPLLNLESVRCILYNGTRDKIMEANSLRDPYFRVAWKPDINSLSNTNARAIFPPTIALETIVPILEKGNRLASYLFVEISAFQEGFPRDNIPEHLQRFLEWIVRCVAPARIVNLPHDLEALSASPEQRSQIIDEISLELDHVLEIKLLKRLYDHLPAVLLNTKSSLQVALQDGLLTEVYKSGIMLTAAYAQFVRLIDLIAHKNPQMKILEIGAGTGGATRYAMKILGGDTNSKRYKDYTFTDITTSFLSPADTEFLTCKGMFYKKLDIEVNPLQQGFEPVYDLVIASQCFHATTTMAKTIQNARKLLKGGGKLVLIEGTQLLNFVGLVFGTFPDYWNGIQDGRIDSPFLTKGRWEELLSNNGFSGIDIVLDDLPEPVSFASTIISTAIEPPVNIQTVEPPRCPSIFIVHLESRPLFSRTLSKQLKQVGISSVSIPLSEARLLENSRVISLVDLERSPLSGTSQLEFEGTKDILVRAATLLWVSAGGLMKASRPTAALNFGLLTTLAIERPSARFVSVDLEPAFDQSATEIAQAIIEKEHSLHLNRALGSRETEYIMDKGCFQISRIIPDHNLNRRFKLQEGLHKKSEMLPLGNQGPIRIAFEQPGLLNSLFFQSDKEYLEALQDGCIEVRTAAVGLNVRVSPSLPDPDSRLLFKTFHNLSTGPCRGNRPI